MNLIAKTSEANRLAKDYQQSLRIEGIIPGAFDHGKVTARWSSVMAPYPSRAQIYTLKLVLGNGDVHTFTGDSIPSFMTPPTKRIN